MWRSFGILCAIGAFILSPRAYGQVETIVVTGRSQNLTGTADPTNQGTISAEDSCIEAALETRRAGRGDPRRDHQPAFGQHGKANQYFLRGFNLDHGTDLAVSVDDIPVNMPSHAHGQGYADLNFMIQELVETVAYKKGPYYADTGDFGLGWRVQYPLLQRTAERLASIRWGAIQLRTRAACG